jgi:hypothetical protein
LASSRCSNTDTRRLLLPWLLLLLLPLLLLLVLLLLPLLPPVLLLLLLGDLSIFLSSWMSSRLAVTPLWKAVPGGGGGREGGVAARWRSLHWE